VDVCRRPCEWCGGDRRIRRQRLPLQRGKWVSSARTSHRGVQGRGSVRGDEIWAARNWFVVKVVVVMVLVVVIVIGLLYAVVDIVWIV